MRWQEHSPTNESVPAPPKQTTHALPIEPASVVLALFVSFVVYIVIAANLVAGSGLELGRVSGLLVAFTLFAGIIMATNTIDGVREVVKQIAVWLGIVVLLPLTVWYGTNVFSPPPNWKEYTKSAERIEQRIGDAKRETEKEKLRDEKARLEEKKEDEERVYYKHMFWVAYPVGLVAIVLGTFFPVQAVGAGLMFGGLISLAAGCYSYWDNMTDQLHFGSLVVALVVVAGLGTWRFRSTS